MELRTFHIKTKVEVKDDATGHWHAKFLFRKASQWDEGLWTLWEQMDDPFSLEIFSHRQHTQVVVTAAPMVCEKIQATLYVMIPEAEFIDITDPMEFVNEDDLIITNEYGLREMSLLPLRDFNDKKHDCLLPLLNVLSGLPYHQKVYVQLLAKKIDDDWKHQFNVKMQKLAWYAEFPFRPIHWFRPKVMERFEKALQKADRMPYSANLRAAVICPPPKDPNDDEELEAIEKEMQISLRCLFHGLSYTEFTHMGRYDIKKEAVGYDAFKLFKERKFKKPFWISRQELATQWHPVQINFGLHLTETIAAKATPPAQLSDQRDPQSVSFIAHTTSRNSKIHFGINRSDRRSHVHIIGKSGVGKSKLIQLLAKSDIDSGYGLGLIDCHGDLVDELLELIPEHRINDVALLDVSDYDYPACFNPFATVKEQNRKYMAQEFLYTLKRLENLSFNEATEQLVINTLIAVMEAPNTSTLSIIKMITEPNYRKALIDSLYTESSKDYWSREREEKEALFKSEQVEAVAKVLYHLLSSDLVSHILGQRENRFDFSEMMENNKIILIKVPKRNLGRYSSVLLGSLVLSLLNVAAAERSKRGSSSSRKDFYFYIDEFQNFASPAATSAIAAGESNQISYTIAHQMISQIPSEVYESLAAKIQNLITFQVGGEDALAIEPRLSPPCERSDFVNLDARAFYIRMLLNGGLVEAFSARTKDVIYPSNNYAQAAREASRKQYARERSEISLSIAREYLSEYEAD